MRGVQNLEGGVAENGDFRQGSHYPWVILGGGLDQSQRYG